MGVLWLAWLSAVLVSLYAKIPDRWILSFRILTGCSFAAAGVCYLFL